MRLFLGVELSEDHKALIASTLEPLKRSEKGWENPHDYHLTFLFIGMVPAGPSPSILARMLDVSAKPITLFTSGFHFFSRRILYLGFEHSPEALALRKKILSVYPEFYRKEEKEFIPHVTVKRWQRHEHAGLVRGLEGIAPFRLEVPVTGLSLFKSEKDSENRKYHVIHRVDF